MGSMSIARGIRDSLQGNDTFIRSRFHFSDSYIFDKFVNWLVLDLYLGGPTYTTTIGNIVWGHVPPVVLKIKNTPPLIGGDPSINEVISLNQNSSSLYQTRYTGKSDFSKVGSFYSTNNLRFVNELKPFWDGQKVRN